MRTLAISLALTGPSLCCARSFSNNSLVAGEQDPTIQEETDRARKGDNHALYELGYRYETGDGVKQDLRKAKSLYIRASRPQGGTQLIFVPQASGVSATPVNTGRYVPGDISAIARLQRLNKANLESGDRLWTQRIHTIKGRMTPVNVGDEGRLCSIFGPLYAQEFGIENYGCTIHSYRFDAHHRAGVSDLYRVFSIDLKGSHVAYLSNSDFPDRLQLPGVAISPPGGEGASVCGRYLVRVVSGRNEVMKAIIAPTRDGLHIDDEDEQRC